MEQFNVYTKDKKYPIILAEDFSYIRAAIVERGLNGRRLCIISDTTVMPLYLDKLKTALEGTFTEVLSFVFEAGENSKTLDTISDIYKFFIDNHFDRKTVVAALGGGVCGDMAGFAAATYMRGVAYIQIPTTLLAQVDSSVGGKTGVDFFGAKNMIGAFYQPELVYINSQTLDTLPKRQFSAGMAEVIKYGYILSAEFLEFLNKNCEQISKKQTNVMLELIGRCCKFKADVVAEDERETGRREILNFGHTIGHAVESKLQFKLLHGECVAIGMLAVLYICVQRGKLDNSTLVDLKKLLEFFELRLNIGESITPHEIYSMLFMDKKVKNNKISFVLLESCGKSFSTLDVSKEEVINAINYVM